MTSPAYFPTFAPAPSINSTNNKVADTSFSYDPAGNLTQAPVAPGGVIQTYAYDAENKLVTFNGGAAAYSYDGDGRRVKKVVGSTTTIFVYDVAGKLAAEYGNAALSGPGGTEYLTADHLGSTRVVTDASGGVISRHDYLPFGEAISTGIGGRTGAMGYEQFDGINQKFTSKERDSESNLDYFGARYYGSDLGRFTTVDPSGMSIDVSNPQSWNKYFYALNAPLSYVDRNGKWPSWVHDEIIDRAFGTTLEYSERWVLKRASVYADRSETQDAAHAYQHAMRDPTDSPEQAESKMMQFINGEIDQAVSAQLEAEKNKAEKGFTGPFSVYINGVVWMSNNYSFNALWHLGQALHAVADSFSPSHEGFQPWSGHETRRQIAKHFFFESTPFTEGERQYLAEVRLRFWFHNFQQRLERARKKVNVR